MLSTTPAFFIKLSAAHQGHPAPFALRDVLSLRFVNLIKISGDNIRAGSSVVKAQFLELLGFYIYSLEYKCAGYNDLNESEGSSIAICPLQLTLSTNSFTFSPHFS